MNLKFLEYVRIKMSKCPFCDEPSNGDCPKCGAYKVITTGSDANNNCSRAEIRSGHNNDTRPRKKR